MKKLGLMVVFLMLLAAPGARGDFNEFEIKAAAASLSNYEAGAHADFTTSFELKTELTGGEVVQTRDVEVALPPGLLGNPAALPQCTMEQLGVGPDSSHCPLDSQVGVTEIQLAESPTPGRQPVYNMTSPGGDVVARFGFMAGFYPTTINVRIRSEGDYGATASIEGAASAAGLESATTTIWGVPTSPVHDPDRITPIEGNAGQAPPGGKRSSTLPPIPFLSNPTRCGVPLSVGFRAASYQLPDSPATKTAPLGTIFGCGKVDFDPSFSAIPTTREAAAPSGIDAILEVPQDETPFGRATSHLKDARVAFPQGMTLAAGAADGLGACSAEEAGYRSRGPGRCPDASKLGTVELDVPGLERPLQGALYQRTPEPGHLFRVWIVADDLGAHVALPGEVELNPLTGQVTSVFLESPEVPLRKLHLRIPGGPRAPFATPASCGTYFTAWQFSPWSGKSPAEGSSPMTIDQGCDTGGFSPRLVAGTASPKGGAFSAFSLDLSQDRGEQNLAAVDVTLPQGLLAKLAGVELCGGAAAASGDCPPASRIGSVAVASGPGSSPLWIPQAGKAPTAIYLSGPYKGAPYSLVIRVPAQAGPLDLGTVVVRSALRVDPVTAKATIASDPLPQFLEGVPVTYRRIHAQVDRPRFVLNPTSCAAKQIKARLTGVGGAEAEAVSPFQATACDRLRFAPTLQLTLEGGTRRTQHPALSATLTQGRGQANNAKATVILPRAQFIDQAHISNPCTRPQFAADKCPSGSVLGTAKAVTPLLDRPLRGRVYFRSNGGARELPDIVADLGGQLHITVIGYVDSVQKNGSSRIRTTFANIPDAPVSKFTMSLFGGKRGLLVNSDNLCRVPHAAQVRLEAQNGKKRTFSEELGIRCKEGSR